MKTHRSYWGIAAVGVAAGVLALSTAIQARPAQRSVTPAKADISLRLSDRGGLQSTAATTCENAGFEVVDGACSWEAGFSICGGAYSMTCSTPIAGSCTGNPLVDINCCIGAPNALNGWYMSGSSQHCREPHIDTINPKTGEQHMRFQADPLGGNPPATTGFGTASRVNAFGPSMGPQSSASPTIMSMDFAMNAAPGVPPFAGSMQNFSVADSEGNSTGVIMYWDKTYGGVYVYDGAAAGYAFLGYATGNGAYNHLQVDLDPCLGTYSYTFDAVDGVHTYSHANAGQSNTIERIIFAHNNVAGPGWDLDNYNVTRLGGCPFTCGDNNLEPWGEECDGTDDANCPGQCTAGCTCPRQCTFEAPCVLDNADNGPYLNSVGFYLYTADTPFTSFNACNTGFDTYMQVYDAADLSTPLAENDDCDNGAYGAGSDPGAPCYNNVPDYESCTCLATVPGTTYLIWVPTVSGGDPALGSSERIGAYKKTVCGTPIPGGACCDAIAGACTDGVDAAACSGDYKTFYVNKTCDLTPACVAVTGACCNTASGAGGACSETTLAQCPVGPYVNWSVGQLCADVNCREVTGACCDTLLGDCAVTVSGGCQGEDDQWSEGRDCTQVQCSPAQGACCDSAVGGDRTQASCTSTSMVECNFVWTRGSTCAEVICNPDFIAIPTVSEWGLVVLALLLLAGGKVYFGRRQSATA
ncbi:MAG: IPTL-CTERM sorting domain-containing protein [Planctomycetota bacterium]